MNRQTVIILGVALFVWAVTPAWVQAEDWPTYRCDNRRSGVTSESLTVPLEQAWEYRSPEAPQMAWAGPAKWDSYANIRKLKSMRNFDPVFHVTAAQGCVFFGSSVDDAVHCFDAATGQEKWVAFANGPVRVPPAFHDGKLYFGSDDGRVYCVDAATGESVWDYQGAPEDRKVPVNRKLTSLHPCRTGALVQDGKVYFAVSLLPWEETYVCALDAATGNALGNGLYRKRYDRMAAQGPMLASSTKIYLSQGRQAPVALDRGSGNVLKSVGKSGFGGVFGLLTEDSILVHGYGQNHGTEGELRFFTGQQQDRLVTFPRATSIVIHQGVVYLHADGQLQAFDRNTYLGLQGRIRELQQKQKELAEKKKKLAADAPAADRANLTREMEATAAKITVLKDKLPSSFLWRVPCDCPYELILAGQTLFAGGEGLVVAHDLATGRELWRTTVAGRAYGLAVAEGRLLVSTDLGRIVCFR